MKSARSLNDTFEDQINTHNLKFGLVFIAYSTAV